MATGTITTSTGLASGIDIGGTVDKLIALAAKPRDMLQTATDTVKSQQVAINGLAASLYAVKYISDNLGKTALFQERLATSSTPGALAATVTGNPAVGTYEFTPLRISQAQKVLSSGFTSDSQPIGAGTVTVRFGDRVDRSAQLSVINGGQGFVRGRIRIVDGNGNAADIDLSTAQTVDDVLSAINGNPTANVTASAQNGHIHLVDNTGGALNLKVQDIGTGRTATSLGLAGINSSTGAADGQNILGLYSGISLSVLNDGMGVETSPTLPDIKYTLRNGDSGEIDFAPHDNTTSQGTPETTLQQIIDEVSTQSGGKLRLSIAADGASLQLTDTTSGSGSYTLQAEYGSRALHDLGLDANADAGGTVTAPADVVSGQRILGGLKTVALGSLNGGKGFGTLGTVSLTDRSGATGTVDLAGARTLDDVVAAINASTVSIRAQVNRAGNGIELADTSGSQAGMMKVEDGDATTTATRLNILSKPATDVNPSATAVNSGDMHLKVIGENTLFSSLNGGAGVARGQFTITDSQGARGTVDLRSSTVKTVGDAIRAINRLGLSVQAELNTTGDGIVLRDTAGGSGTLATSEVGSGTTAHDLGLRRDAAADADGGQSIDGTMTYTIDIWQDDTLQNVAAQINQLKAGFSAAVVSDASVQPFHLSLTSGRAGKAGAMVVDTSGAGFTVDETAKAQDSLLLLGAQTAEATAALVSSSSNTFSNLVDGLSLQVKQGTGQTVSVSVDSTTTNLSASVKTFVDNYNKFRDSLTTSTKYDTTQNTASVLTGDSTALRFDTDLSGLLSSRFAGAGKFDSLAAMGITFTQDGKLQYDDATLQAAIASDPAAVKDFFTTKDTGFSAKLGAMIERLAGEDNSLVSARTEALDFKVTQNQKRIEEMTASLASQRETLLTQFYNMDLAISKFQTSLKALDSIQWMLNGNLYDYGSNSSSSSSGS
jgi:flagellar hook-associated protein 2